MATAALSTIFALSVLLLLTVQASPVAVDRQLVEQKTDLRGLGCWAQAVQSVGYDIFQYLAFCWDYGLEQAGIAQIPACLLTNFHALLHNTGHIVAKCITGGSDHDF